VAQTVGDSTIGADVGTEREDTLDRGAPALAEVRALLGTGDVVADRYRLTTVLGAGAMGIVLAARDLLLDRDVALKVLRREAVDPTSELHERLVSEARALAQVAHPNVVSVFDVGRISGRTYVAMELVKGVDLRKWLEREKDRRVRVDAIVQAGRGLAAAHAVGVVHRDFKPENVLVGDDARVRVADFGLAHTVEPEDDASTVRDGSTRAHALIGTPMYMAPEQFLHAPASMLTDQFGFFVALFEVLHDTRPFHGNTVFELAAKMLGDEAIEPPPGGALARRLAPVLRRGLARTPARRFPDMDAALTAIEQAIRPRRAWGWSAVAGVGALAIGVAAWPSDPPDACTRLAERRAEVWNDAARARVRASFADAGASFSGVTSDTVERELDAWTEAWDRERARACDTTSIETRHDCLGSALARTAALVDRLDDASAADVRRAVAAVGELPPAERCRGPDTAAGDPALHERFAALEAALELAHNGEAARIARELLEITAGNSVDDVHARLDLGLALAGAEDYDEAQTELSAAFYAAVALGDEPHASEAANRLAHVHTFGLADLAEAETWVRHAESHARDDDAKFVTALSAAHLAYARGEYDEAGAAFERLLQPETVTPLRRAALQYDLGFTRHLQGRWDEAAAHLERAELLFESELGATHPDVGDVLLIRSQVAMAKGQLALARELAEHGLAILEGAYGTEHSNVANALSHLADAMPSSADDREALALLERAVAIVENARGRDHPAAAAMLTDLANRRAAAGDHARALVETERAMRVAESALGEHPFFANSLHNWARELEFTGHRDAAIAAWTRSIALRERLLSPDDPGLVPALVGLGKTLVAAGRRAEGIAALERAWTICTTHGVTTHLAGSAAWNLAKAIDVVDPDRALELARAALQFVRDDPQLRADLPTEIERWIAERSK
jgi:tetratricopeptide (TPR) repeat protein/predicted Ser/Thr protein kinase